MVRGKQVRQGLAGAQAAHGPSGSSTTALRIRRAAAGPRALSLVAIGLFLLAGLRGTAEEGEMPCHMWRLTRPHPSSHPLAR